MTSNRPGTKKTAAAPRGGTVGGANPRGDASGGAAPTTKQTARQERLARRNSSRDLGRASTAGGGGHRSILAITGLFAIVAIVAIGAAYLATRPTTPAANTGIILTPQVLTPATVPADGRTIGRPSAPVTLVVLEDFRCTYCYDFTMTTEPQLVADFVESGKLKIVYQDMLSIDKDGSTASRDAANAGLCANDEGKFWLMHDWLFVNQDRGGHELPSAFTQDRLIAIGRDAGLSDSKFVSCVQNGTHDGEVASEQRLVPAGVGGTPGFVINGKVFPVAKSFDEVSAAINAELAALAGASSSASIGPSPSAS